jgi:osmotically-inducible protein OsmY
MFHIGHRSFTHAVIVGGLLSLAMSAEGAQGAPRAAAPAQPAQAPQQAQASPDAQLAAKVHQALLDDKALSGYAPTIKIIVNDGLVSLKGAVKTDADKKAIGAKADAIAGAKNVMNNLVVSASSAPAKPQTR